MPDSVPHRSPFLKSLSARLLVLTVFFIMVSEFFIYAPSISRFRKVYLEDHIASAHLATLALGAIPDSMVSKELERELLYRIGAYGIILRSKEKHILALSEDMPPKVDATFDLRKGGTFIGWISAAFGALARNDNRAIRVIGYAPKDPDIMVEVILDEKPLREAMLAYSTRILQLSVVISLFTGGLVYLSLQFLMIRPIGRITHSMASFRENPEGEGSTISSGGRSDEIGIAQRELAVMQDELRASLNQKTRLATVGTAVAKLNHDLRNSLSSVMLASGRLADIDDPEVRKLTPLLYEAVDRAVNLCSQTLVYVGEGGVEPKPVLFHLQELTAEVDAALNSELADGDEGKTFKIRNAIDFAIDVKADRIQLFRAFSNLLRNARQAGAKSATVSAEEKDGRLYIEIKDDGPGLPRQAQEKMFQPFAGSAREGGTGLGLVIVQDILKAHGGGIELVETGKDGSTFCIDLPAAGSTPV